ncbi:hypothetical protein Tco_0250654 [Tanacetum coccineum]
MMMEILPEPTSNKLCGRSDTYAGNPIKEILLNLNLPDHKSVLTEPKGHVKMEMEIPCSSRVKFITACSYSIDKYTDMMKAQVHVTQVFRYSDTQKIFLEVIIRIQVKDIVKEVEDYLKTYSLAGMDISWYVDGIR